MTRPLHLLLGLSIAHCSPAPTPTMQPPPATGSTAEATTAPSPPTSTPTMAPADQSGSLLERLMQSHFVQVHTIRTSVIAGNTNGAIGPARTIAKLQGVDSLPASWQPAVRRLQAASSRIRQSADLPEAAAATADIGVTCADCHVANGGPNVTVGAPPAALETVADRMRRHQWATERLWEGLYAPSDDAWKAGSAILGEAPWADDVVSAGGVHGRSLADRFVALGRKAPSAVGGARAEVYAALLATCAPCHEQTRRKK